MSYTLSSPSYSDIIINVSLTSPSYDDAVLSSSSSYIMSPSYSDVVLNVTRQKTRKKEFPLPIILLIIIGILYYIKRKSNIT